MFNLLGVAYLFISFGPFILIEEYLNFRFPYETDMVIGACIGFSLDFFNRKRKQTELFTRKEGPVFVYMPFWMTSIVWFIVGIVKMIKAMTA